MRSIHLVEEAILEDQIRSLDLRRRLLSDLVASLAGTPIRDLHILSRYFGWLLFGGITRSDSFTELLTGSEACKSESNPSECSFLEANQV